MVKNDAGGNKGKGLARKHVNAAKGGSSKQLRVAVDEAEKYAIVSKMLGNGMCYVRLLDGSTRDRLCIIRNKFKGRGKRDNILDTGSWVLVGLREWSSKQDTCDLLEVYNASERDRLLKNEPCFKAVECNNGTNTSTSTSTNNPYGNNTSSSSNSAIQFADSATMKYSSMLNNKGISASANANAGTSDSDDDVPMQQRVYDMPPSDSDNSDSEEEAEESDQSKSDQSKSDQSNQSEESEESEESDQSEESEESYQSDEVNKSIVNAKKTMNKCEINVDDI